MAAKKVLIVDDDREWNLLLKMKLGIAGYKVDQAFNGKQGMEKISADKPDLVLLDITMPVMDGWDVCQALRENPDTKELPIIIQSSMNQSDDVQRGKSYSVLRYLLKPCSPEVIVQNVRDVLAPKA